MTIVERIAWNLGVAWDALSTHRGRSILATSGIAIGIASVIMMAAIGAGLRAQISSGVSALRSTTVFVRPGDPATAVRPRDARLRDADLRIAAALGGDALAASGQLRARALAQNGGASASVDVVGADVAYEAIGALAAESGRLLRRDDIDGARMVAVIDTLVASDLSRSARSGGAISLAGRPFTVIGVVKAQPGASGGTVIIPVSTMRQRIPGAAARPGELTSIMVAIRPGSEGEEVASDLTARLRAARRLDPGDELPLRISTSAEFARQANGVVRALQVGLIAIASISLFVGAIGVMNIMLVAVRERTSEIGLRLAVGATPRDILEQFLTESALLCLIGGCIGVTIGILVAAAISALSGWQAWPSATTMGLAILVSAGVGMIAGLAPARSAAALPPIVAIRRE